MSPNSPSFWPTPAKFWGYRYVPLHLALGPHFLLNRELSSSSTNTAEEPLTSLDLLEDHDANTILGQTKGYESVLCHFVRHEWQSFSRHWTSEDIALQMTAVCLSYRTSSRFTTHTDGYNLGIEKYTGVFDTFKKCTWGWARGLGIVAHAFSPSTLRQRQVDLLVQSQPGLQQSKSRTPGLITQRNPVPGWQGEGENKTKQNKTKQNTKRKKGKKEKEKDAKGI